MWGGALKLLDTNIFIYAQGQPHRFRDACQMLVASMEEDNSLYAIDTELLQEILHVYSARGERARALRTFDRLLLLFPNPAPVGKGEMVVARQLVEAYPTLLARDAIHAAVVQTNGLEGIVTTDRAFREIPGLVVFDSLDLASGR
ncbi:MAG: PIN domain-containing protein [Dehalococcoidia bacterium]|nr:PIN domain-containing protein [Dehalococcoidia bacterium]